MSANLPAENHETPKCAGHIVLRFGILPGFKLVVHTVFVSKQQVRADLWLIGCLQHCVCFGTNDASNTAVFRSRSANLLAVRGCSCEYISCRRFGNEVSDAFDQPAPSCDKEMQVLWTWSPSSAGCHRACFNRDTSCDNCRRYCCEVCRLQISE